MISAGSSLNKIQRGSSIYDVRSTYRPYALVAPLRCQIPAKHTQECKFMSMELLEFGADVIYETSPHPTKEPI